MPLKRDLIMQAVVTRMEGILVASGYYSNLGSKVIEWRPKVMLEGGVVYVPTEQHELPALHVRDPIDFPTTVEQSGSEEHELNVEFEIAHEGGGTGATMRKQIADVLKAIGVDPTWGDLATKTVQEAPAETIRIQADRAFFRTLLQMKISYSTSAFAEE